MRSCLPQGNLSVEEEFKLLGELPAHYIHMNTVVHTALFSYKFDYSTFKLTKILNNSCFSAYRRDQFKHVFAVKLQGLLGVTIQRSE